MVSDVAELTRTLRKSTPAPTGNGFAAELRTDLRTDLRTALRSRLRNVSNQIKADLNSTGQSIFTDEHGNRYLIQREPGTP